MPDLTDEQLRILRVLDERDGRTFAAITTLAIECPNRDQAWRAWSCRRRVLHLQSLGLVAPLDDRKPVAWVRTAAGTGAVEKT